MTRNRSKLEIYLDVLWAMKDGTDKPTRIMCDANLSWNPFQKILDSLVDQGLVMEIASDEEDKRTPKVYKITQKGENTLKYFSRVRELLVVM